VRIETDAPSTYHNAENIKNSRINIIIDGDDVQLSGTTPLKDGRMRVILDASKNSIPESIGEFSIEISRPGLPALCDKISYLIIEKPEAPPDEKKISIPPIDWIPVESPNDPTWSALDWPEDIEQVASSSNLGSDKLVVYYSKVFPRYDSVYKQFEKTSIEFARSFEIRYRIWLAVHSLLIEQDKRECEDVEIFERSEQEERCRLAMIASMFAAREVRSSQELPHLEID
jgi:hypothetical protein